jgi:hypothetical protein
MNGEMRIPYGYIFGKFEVKTRTRKYGEAVELISAINRSINNEVN